MAQLYEYYNTGADGWRLEYGVYWDAQTFTVGATAHIITYVRLQVTPSGTDAKRGPVTVSIRATDAGGLPTGADLTSGVRALIPEGTNWVEFELTPIILSANTKYAIVVRAPDANYANRLGWRCDTTSPTYADGNRCSSTNSGVSWTAQTGDDLMFEVWGWPTDMRRLVQNLSVITDVFSWHPKLWVRTFRENLWVLRDLFRRRISFPRRMCQDLSVIRDIFSSVYTPLVVPVRYFTENLSSISDRFVRTVGYSRTFLQETRVQDVFKRSVGFPKKFIEDLSSISTVFRRQVSIVRRLLQNLSVIKDLLVGKKLLLPSTVGTATHDDAKSHVFQRKCFYAKGRHWDFYSDGTSFGWKSSTDGINWSDFTVVISGVSAGDRGYQQSVYFDGYYVHLVWARVAAGGGGVFYRRGTPNEDGTIDWEAQRTVDPTSNSCGYPNVTLDSEGYPWVTYSKEVVGVRIYVCKATAQDGSSWGTITDLSGADGYEGSLILRKNAGRMYCLYSLFASPYTLYGKEFDGSTWGSVETLEDKANFISFSAVSEGDIIHVVYTQLTTNNIRYNRRDTSWGTPVTIQASTSAVIAPALSITVSKTLYCFWTSSPTANHVYYKKCVDGTWDASPTDWFTEPTPFPTEKWRLSAFPQQYSQYLGLNYVAGTSSPYAIRYNFLTISLWVRLKQNLSVLADKFIFVLTPLIPVYRLIQNLSSIGDISRRKVAYARRQVQEILIWDVFKRIVGFPRKFVEDLSALKAVFIRKVAFLRRFVENLSVLKDVFSFVYVPIIKVYRLVQTLIIQAFFTRRVSYKRRLANRTLIQDLFKRVVGFPRRLTQNLSTITVRLIRRTSYLRKLKQTTLVADILRRVVGFPRRLKQDLSTIKDVFTRRVAYLRRLRQNLVIRDVFSFIFVPIVKVYRLVQTLIIQSVLVRRAFYIRRFVDLTLIRDLFKRVVGFPRRLAQNLSAISVRLVRRVSYLRKMMQTLFVRDAFIRRLAIVKRLIQSILVSDVFRRIQALRRALRQDLSRIQDVFIRRLSYLRRLAQFTYIQDKFTSVYTAFVRVYRLIQTLFISVVLRRRTAYTRKVQENLSVLKDVFSSVYTKLVRIYRFVENLSTIGDVFRYQITYNIAAIREKLAQVQAEIADLYEKVKKKAEFVLRRR